MNRFLLLIVFLVSARLSWGQTPADLVRDVRENTNSVTLFMNAVQKQTGYRDTLNSSWYDTAALLGHTLYLQDYRYNSSIVTVKAIYRNEHLAYVSVINGKWTSADTLFRYVNAGYTTRVLGDYNRAHHTDFTWVDLYEDELNYFGGLPGLYEVPKPLTPEEMEKGILRDDTAKVKTTKEYEPLLVKRDHKTIIKHCKSFNPARKAYGAYCLYILKNEGVPLSEEEKKLFEQISHSNETTELHAGCLGYRNVRLSSFLCREHLDPTCDELRTPEDLASALQQNLGSVTAFLKELKVHTVEKEQKGYFAGFNESAGLMDHKSIWQRILYSRRDWAHDSVIYTEVYVKAVYKGEKLRYVQLEEHYNIDYTGHFETRELMKYVDSAYARQILLPHNEKYKTDFAWKDLFEDKLRNFEIYGDVVAVEYYDRPDGTGRDSVLISGGMRIFWPMIRDHDHMAVMRNCKSINPVRKAFALVCLYIWQQRGEILSPEELNLLQSIARMNETITYKQGGCKYDPDAKIREVLSEENLQHFYISIYRTFKTQTSPR
jgi:hypothetical protein